MFKVAQCKVENGYKNKLGIAGEETAIGGGRAFFR